MVVSAFLCNKLIFEPKSLNHPAEARVQRSKNNYIDINFAIEVANQQQHIHNSLTPKSDDVLGVCMFLTVNNTFWQVLQMLADIFFLHSDFSQAKMRNLSEKWERERE